MLKISEIYKNLYHYTTWDGLLGILQTQTMWATHCKFLNDYSELILMRDKLIEFTSPIVEKNYRDIIKEDVNAQATIDEGGGLNKIVQDDAEVVIDASYKAIGEEFYILSFCGEDKNSYINNNGLLSQWRGYGVGGSIALVFNTNKLEEILKIEGETYSFGIGHLSTVIYSDDEVEFKKELYEQVGDFTKYVQQIFDCMELGNKEPPDAMKAFPAFVSCISRYKHHSFKEENEVRAVFLANAPYEEYLRQSKDEGQALKPEKERKFRTKNGRLIPYIELFNSNDIVLPIEKIIIGPHKEKELRASALRVMLRNTNIKVTISDIPYVT